MKINRKLLFFIVPILLLSCEKNIVSNDLLRKAQSIVNSDAIESLAILDSISNPEEMDKNNYMQYIVVKTQAKYQTYQNVANDTLIFEAEKYFDRTGDYSQAVLAHFYAGGVYREKKMPDKSLESFLSAKHYSEKLGNNLQSGKIADNIGTIYYENGLMDSAVIYFKKAFNFYEKGNGSDRLKMQATNLIGRSFYVANNLDSANSYFSKYLSFAERLDSKPDKAISLKNLGVVSYDKGEYDKAINYLQSSLELKSTNKIQTVQIYLILLNILNKRQDYNSSKQYAELIISSLPEISYIYTTKEMYTSLAEYYELVKNEKEALKYTKLAYDIDLQIIKEERPYSVLNSAKNYQILAEETKSNEFKSEAYIIFIIFLVALIITISILIFLYKINKRHKKYLEAQKQKNNEIKQILTSMNNAYLKIEAEMKLTLDEAEKN